MIIIYYQHNVD